MNFSEFLNNSSKGSRKETSWNYSLIKKNFPKFFPKKAQSCGLEKITLENYLKMLSTETEKKTPRKTLQLKRAELASLYRSAKAEPQKVQLLAVAEEFYTSFVSEAKPEKTHLINWLLKEE